MRAGAAKYLNKAWHKVEHTLGTNKGTIETWWEGEHLMVGFKCSCGEMQGVARTTIKRKQPSLLVEYHGEGREALLKDSVSVPMFLRARLAELKQILK